MDLPQYQDIEDAYKVVEKVIDKLPESNWTDRAKEHLKISEQATYQGRERAKADRTEVVSGVSEPPALVEYRAEILRWGSCHYPSTYCSCGARDEGD